MAVLCLLLDLLSISPPLLGELKQVRLNYHSYSIKFDVSCLNAVVPGTVAACQFLRDLTWAS